MFLFHLFCTAIAAFAFGCWSTYTAQLGFCPESVTCSKRERGSRMAAAILTVVVSNVAVVGLLHLLFMAVYGGRYDQTLLLLLIGVLAFGGIIAGWMGAFATQLRRIGKMR